MFPPLYCPLSYKKHNFWKFENIIIEFGLAKTILESSKCFGMYQESTWEQRASLLNSKKAGSWDPLQLIFKQHLLQFVHRSPLALKSGTWFLRLSKIIWHIKLLIHTRHYSKLLKRFQTWKYYSLNLLSESGLAFMFSRRSVVILNFEVTISKQGFFTD